MASCIILRWLFHFWAQFPHLLKGAMVVPYIKPVCTGTARGVVQAGIIQLVGVYNILLVKYFQFHSTCLTGKWWGLNKMFQTVMDMFWTQDTDGDYFDCPKAHSGKRRAILPTTLTLCSPISLQPQWNSPIVSPLWAHSCLRPFALPVCKLMHNLLDSSLSCFSLKKQNKPKTPATHSVHCQDFKAKHYVSIDRNSVSNKHSNLVNVTFLGSRFKVLCLWNQPGWLSLLGAKQRSLNFRLACGCFCRVFSFSYSLHSDQLPIYVFLKLCPDFALERKGLSPFHPQRFFPFNLGCCSKTLQILPSPSVLTPESMPHLSRLSPLAGLPAQVTKIREDNFDQSPNECVWKERESSVKHPGILH